ncbi:MAG: Calcium-dependent protease precursor [Verrucomicrobiota bacterium]
MKQTRLTWPRTLLCLALAAVGAAGFLLQARDTSGDRPRVVAKDLGDPERALVPGEEVAGNLAGSFDVGDYYLTPDGPRPLRRLAGSVAVRFKPEIPRRKGLQELAGTNGPLHRYRASSDSLGGLTLLQAPSGITAAQKGDPRQFSQALAKARRNPAVQSANPVFIEPDTGLARVTTEEILICLRPGTEPEAYFGAAWPQVRPLGGAPEVFILTQTAATVETLLTEANRHATDPRVAWAQPNFISQVLKQSGDPLYPLQWNLHNTGQNAALPGADVNAPQAWARTTGRPEVVIAILDDGVQGNHPDLATNLFVNPGELANLADDDGNGYTNDFSGWDFLRNDNAPNPEFARDNHGTAVAGVAAAAANTLGGSGIAPRCRILPVRILGGDAWVSDGTLAEAIYYAAGRTRDGQGAWRGADILNLSLSFPQSAVVDGALAWAAVHGRGGKGCTIFAAAGDRASRWQTSRIRLPVGSLLGPGSYRFGFEYSKDVNDPIGAAAPWEDLVRIDNVALVGSDGVTLVNSALGTDGRQDFEGTFPPAGWQTNASPGGGGWLAQTNQALTGTRGNRSARSGPIANNLYTELRTPAVTLSGGESLTFACAVSSEPGYDGLRVWVYTGAGDYVTVLEGRDFAPLVSGHVALTNAVSYPASHPAVIAVGASTDAEVRADYSATGPGLELVAPASGGWNDIITTDRTGPDGYGPGDHHPGFGGTSAAAPLAAGIGALALSVNPTLTAAELRSLLRDGCEKIGDVPYDANGWHPDYGYGRLNAQHVVESVVAPFSIAITTPTNGALFASGSPILISAAAISVESAITQVDFYAGATWIGRDETAPYSLLWNSPAIGTVPITARLLDSRGSNLVSAPVLVTLAPSLSVTDASVLEGNKDTTNMTFEVRLSARSTDIVQVDYRVENGSALSGIDFLPTAGTLVFPPGTTNLTVRVPVIGNLLSESNRTVILRLLQPVNAGLARAEAVGLIIDNRDPVPTLAIEDVTLTEGDGGTSLAQFDVQLSTRSGQTVTVRYATASGSAAAGLDFQASAGTVTFPPGILNQTVSIPVLGDPYAESNKFFVVNLTNANGATIARSQARGTILDNDADPLLRITDSAAAEGQAGGSNHVTFQLSLSSRSGKPITVNYATTGGSALTSKDFLPARGTLSFAPGQTNQTLRVTSVGDTVSESNETFLVSLAAPVNAFLATPQGIGTLLDDDPLPGLTISDVRGTEGDTGSRASVFTVRLAPASGRTVTVQYTTADASASAGTDYLPTNGVLTFKPGLTSQTLRVAVLGNTISESNEVFHVNLTNPTNAVLQDGQGAATILDNDRLPSLFINDITVAERYGQPGLATFSVRLTPASERAVTFRFATSNGTALAEQEYAATNGFLIIPPGQTNVPLSIALQGNPPSQGFKSFAVGLFAPTNATLGDGRGTCTLRIDDAPFFAVAAALPAAAPAPEPAPPSNPAASGLDPRFRITAARLAGPDVLVSFTSVAGHHTVVEFTDGLNGPMTVWTPIPGGESIPGTGEVLSVTDPGAAGRPYRFYRVRLLP